MCIYGNVHLGTLNMPKGAWAVPFLHLIEIKTVAASELSKRAVQSKETQQHAPPFITVYRSSLLHVQKRSPSLASKSRRKMNDGSLFWLLIR
jgi:hypothetical protein